MRTGGLEMTYDITGTEGMFRFTEDGLIGDLWVFEKSLPGERRPAPARHILRPAQKPRATGVHALYDLLHCIETGEDSRCPGEDAREALEIAIAVRESHRQGGGRVDLPIEDRSLGIVSREVLDHPLPRAIETARAAASQG